MDESWIECQECEEDEFVCLNRELMGGQYPRMGGCIPRSAVCDGVTDCFDNRDEDNCVKCDGNHCSSEYNIGFYLQFRTKKWRPPLRNLKHYKGK